MPEEERTGVRLTNLDQPLFEDAGATKRDLVDYLEAAADRLVPVLAERALSVVRILRGQGPFMQKNLPTYAPASIPTLDVATQDGKRVVRYPVCNDRETLLWFANQRAGEDQRGQGRARCRPTGPRAHGDGRRCGHACARRPRGAARSEADDDGLRRRGTRRQGFPRRDASGRGDGG